MCQTLYSVHPAAPVPSRHSPEFMNLQLGEGGYERYQSNNNTNIELHSGINAMKNKYKEVIRVVTRVLT